VSDRATFEQPHQYAVGVSYVLVNGEVVLADGAVTGARPGRVLTREQLLDLAHPHGEEAFDRSIDVRIARIRRKLEKDPANPKIIRTVRGAGYVFDPDGTHPA
jgi:hypothetical protein